MRLHVKQLEYMAYIVPSVNSVTEFPTYISLHFLVYLDEYLLRANGKSNLARSGNLN